MEAVYHKDDVRDVRRQHGELIQRRSNKSFHLIPPVSLQKLHKTRFRSLRTGLFAIRELDESERLRDERDPRAKKQEVDRHDGVHKLFESVIFLNVIIHLILCLIIGIEIIIICLSYPSWLISLLSIIFFRCFLFARILRIFFISELACIYAIRGNLFFVMT
jgi:hypothetical protein